MTPSRALIRFLVWLWLVVWIPALLLAGVVICQLLWQRRETLLLLFVTLPMLSCLVSRWFVPGQGRRNPWLWRLSRWVAPFHAVSGGRVSVLFPAGLDRAVDLGAIMRWSASDLDDMARRFGFPLRHHLTVVLMNSHRDITTAFGFPMGGTALAHANAVVLAADCDLRVSLRHELVHLFAARWNLWAPPLLQEGLAVWLQGTESDVPIEKLAGPLLRESEVEVDPLLDSGYFFCEAHRDHCYLLAGGFTGFLVRRFGWDAYRALYRRAIPRTFGARFEKRFGMSLEAAWRRWRDEVIAMNALGRRLWEDRLFN